MKTLAVVLVAVATVVGMSSVRADTAGRVLDVEGEVLSDGASPAAGVDLADGTILVAASYARARVSIPGAGELRLVGPAAVRLGHDDGIPSLMLLRGEAFFAYGGRSVRLSVEGGRLHLSDVNGRSAALGRGAELAIDGSGADARATLRSGSALFSGDLEHVLLRAGESRRFGAPRVGAQSLLLSGHELELQLPTEVLLEGRGEGSPAIEELRDAWNRNRESPRIP